MTTPKELLQSALADTGLLETIQQERIHALRTQGKHANADALAENPITPIIASPSGHTTHYTLLLQGSHGQDVIQTLTNLEPAGVIAQNISGDWPLLRDRGVLAVAVSIPHDETISIAYSGADKTFTGQAREWATALHDLSAELK